LRYNSKGDAMTNQTIISTLLALAALAALAAPKPADAEASGKKR
jgi:hypothetical protein